MSSDDSIMVVDDNHQALQLVTEYLASAGYHVRPADSGELALASIKAEAPNLVMLDVRMPGLGGFELCRRIKAMPGGLDLPVIFISGVSEYDERVEGLGLGASDFLLKPIQREELLARVGIHLELAHMRRRITGQVEALRTANAHLQAEIAERRRVADALLASQELLRATAKATRTGGWEYDPASGSATWTEEVQRILGLEAGQQPTLAGCLAMVQPDEREAIERTARQLARTGEPIALDVGMLTARGEPRLMHVTGTARRRDGAVIALWGTLQDITERKLAEQALAETYEGRRKAEAALMEAERNATIGRLAGRVAHEVNNPLGSIKAYIDLLRRRAADRRDIVDSLDVVDRQVDRVARLVRSLLEFERQRAPNRTPANPAAVIKTVAELMGARAAKEGKRLVLALPPALPETPMDNDQIQQVLFNLIDNALDASPGGGAVGVSAEATVDGVVVTVSDRGPGLGEAPENLFVPFVSGKEHGSGLGLHLARRICEAHGGWLRGANRSGGGSVFTFLLPTSKETA